MVRTKGVTDAIHAWAYVRRSLADAKLLMLGSGPQRERASALAESLGVSDAIEWRRFVSEEEKRRILSKSRLSLAPYLADRELAAILSRRAGSAAICGS